MEQPRPFSMMTTSVQYFMQLGLGVTIEKMPRQFQPKAEIASWPPWAQAVFEGGFSLVRALPQMSNSQRKVLANKLLFDRRSFVKYQLPFYLMKSEYIKINDLYNTLPPELFDSL